MRLLNYPEAEERGHGADVDKDEVGEIGCGEHTDYGCLTMVNQDPAHTNTLQVCTWVITGTCIA